MEYTEFKQKMITSLPVGTVLTNPGGGTSTIEAYSYDKVRYRRGASSMHVRFQDLFAAYQRFQGGNVSSADLGAFMPSVFDSHARPAGHSCNCTFFYMALQRMGIVSKINGRGVGGNPFYVFIPL